MRLNKFEIKNFKGIKGCSFEWEDIVVLIGENNVGKSTCLLALKWFLSGSQIKDRDLFCEYVCDDEHAIELIGYFDQLSPAEQDSPAVRGRMHNGLWIIKKKFWIATEGGDQAEWKERYYSFSSQETFLNWPESDNSWSNFPAEYQELLGRIPSRGSRPNQQTREQLREVVRSEMPHLITQSSAEWIENPGGGGNWKSNANSIIPRFIIVPAVQEAAEEAISKEASAYGKIVNLIVEKKLLQRPEVTALKAQMEEVLKLFRFDPRNPDGQASEIRDVEKRINEKLNEVTGGIVSIETSEPDIRPVLLPSTELLLKDSSDGLKTSVIHQGHGLQRTLIMTLLQILSEIQSESIPTETEEKTTHTRSVVLAVEEPELYMHPQMERKMRDALYKLASQNGIQVISTTHSPVFLDMAQRHRSIVRVIKRSTKEIDFSQVTEDLFSGPGADAEKDRLRLIATFHPSVNEVFFARRVVLLEEQTALSAFERASELLGIFTRHPHVRRDVTLIDAKGKGNIPMLQKVLNHFQIPYTVVHDEDRGNLQPSGEPLNETIGDLLQANGDNRRYIISPTNMESLLGYAASKDKPFQVLKKIEELHTTSQLPQAFLVALNWVYFGQGTEPS